MQRILRTLLAVLALLFGAVMTTELRAQSPQSVDLNASVTIDPFISCTANRHLEFGPHFAREGVIASSGSNYAALTCSTDPGNVLNISFAAPSSLTHQSNGSSVPITYGGRSGRIKASNGTGDQRFAPAGGLAGYTSSTDQFTISLGEVVGTDLAEKVTVDLTGRPRGTYSGVITVTIAVP
jgi:hypothetical protein